MTPHSHLKRTQSKKFVERRKTRVAIIIVGICALVTGGTYCLTRLINLNIFTIQHVTVSGADSDITGSIQSAALATIQGDYLGLVSRANTFFSPLIAVKNAVMKASPRIATVDVHRAGLQALLITVTEKTPAALVCAGLPDFAGNTLSLGQDDNCYFADASGYIYSDAPSFSGDVYNRYYVPSLADVASSTDVVGSYATSTDEFSALQKLFNDLKSASIDASAVLVKDGGEYELYVRNPSQTLEASSTDSDMAVIYFNNARPFSEQLINLVSFWKKMLDNARAKHEPLSFEYIDVRYGSNVFYRLSR